MIMAFLFLSPLETIQYEARFWLQHMLVIVHHSEKLQHEEQELANLLVDRLKDKIKNNIQKLNSRQQLRANQMQKKKW